MEKRWKRLTAAVIAVLAVGMCSGCTASERMESGETAVVSEETEILVAAAASLKNVFEEELIPMFQETTPGVTVTGTYDSSGKLMTQIQEGLSADVFVSAATKQMNILEEGGFLADGTVTDLLVNRIVLIVPADSTLELTGFADITEAPAIALGDPASVPAGQYAEEALKSLGVWDEIQDRVSFGTNVTEVLNQVASSSADAGIVYATDACSMADRVWIVAEAPEGSLKEKVIYRAALIKQENQKNVAQSFLDFLKCPVAMAVFEQYGFSGV